MKTAALDIDQVLLDIMNPLNEFYNDKSGASFKLDDYFTFDLHEVWGITGSETVTIVEDFYGSSLFEGILPIEGSQQSVELLSKIYRLISISSRPDFVKAKTIFQLKKFFPGKIAEVICNGHYNKGSSKMSKLGSCLEYNAEFIVEDNAPTVVECAMGGVRSFLFDRPWNQSCEEHESIIRVKNWEEILEKLRS